MISCPSESIKMELELIYYECRSHSQCTCDLPISHKSVTQKVGKFDQVFLVAKATLAGHAHFPNFRAFWPC